MTIDQWFTTLTNIKTDKQTDRQTLICQMATLLTMVLPEKEDISNPKKLVVKIGSFV